MLRWGWLNRLLGNRGERIAARYLRRQGYRILARQARNRVGEIDLIAQDRSTIVFIEVKTRSSTQKGHPHEAVDRAKQRQLTRAALAWLKQRNLLEVRCRFDVISIVWRAGSPPDLKHYRNAFEPTGHDTFFS